MAPERLNNEGFIEMINATKVRLIAIDEAHCISEWGHAFRPDYLKGRSLFTRIYPGATLMRCCCRSCKICQRGSSRKSLVLDCNSMYLRPFYSVSFGAWEVADCLKATPKVAEDICTAFNIDAAAVFRTTTYRGK